LQGGRFELRVKTQKKGIWASLTDVGFGISHFLPIIVADLQLERTSTLLIEQPELHLHPSVQATLADYFIRQATTQDKQYIIETHSEYLLNRIRLAIVKEEIAPSDISVYFFENSQEGTITHEIEFTKDGQIKNAPQGFFDTYMMDVMNIALYA
jgi:predicted ATPase